MIGLIDTLSKAQPSLYIQRVSGTRQGEKTEESLPNQCSETPVISGRVVSGPSSPDAHYSDQGDDTGGRGGVVGSMEVVMLDGGGVPGGVLWRCRSRRVTTITFSITR